MRRTQDIAPSFVLDVRLQSPIVYDMARGDETNTRATPRPRRGEFRQSFEKPLAPQTVRHITAKATMRARSINYVKAGHANYFSFWEHRAAKNYFISFRKFVSFLQLPAVAAERKSIGMNDSRLSPTSNSSDKDRSSVLRLSLTALALIAGGLFLMMQDDSLAGSPPQLPPHTSR